MHSIHRLIIKITIAIFCFGLSNLTFADTDITQAYWSTYQRQKAQYLTKGQELYDMYPTSILYYYGFTLNDPLVRVFDWDRWPENIQSVELAHTLSKENGIRQFFYPIVGVVQVAFVFTIRNGTDEPTIYEVDPYIGFRWANMPWNNFVVTSFAIGEGLSFVSSIPSVEKKDNNNTKRLLNYLMFEATFALPKYPRFQIIARIHHRSGAYGLFKAGNTGSNDVGFAIRYLFD